ncbi:MAG: SusE domain-containing protein [Bacteroidales bacterium]
MRILKYILPIISLLFILPSCTKEDSNKTYLYPDIIKSGVVQIPEAIIIEDAKKGENLPEITWSPSEYGFDAAVTYVVELALKGTNFNPFKVIGSVSKPKLVLKGSELQSAMDGLKAVLGTKQEVELRVKSSIVDQYDPIVSNVVSFFVTTYIPAEKEYNKVWIVGDYCGWNHSQSQFLYDIAGDKKYYEGWIMFNDKAQNGFKITYTGGWNGDDIGTNATSVVNNKIKVEPGGNITLFNGKIMYLKLDNIDQSNRTLESVKTISRIGLIGDATPNGWNSPDTELTFNENTRCFEAVVTLSNGEVKFRADNDWGLNWGKFDTSAGKNPNQLNPGGGNIAVTAGTYKVVFNLNKVDPTYSLVQQ